MDYAGFGFISDYQVTHPGALPGVASTYALKSKYAVFTADICIGDYL